MTPEKSLSGRLKKKSNNPSDPAYDPSAIAKSEYTCTYTDTVIYSDWIDSTDNRPHIPLGLNVIQHTFAFGDIPDSAYWKFIIWDFKIKNIGTDLLKDLFFGVLCNGKVGKYPYPIPFDDLSGFVSSDVSPLGNPVENIAWWADNNGDPNISTGYFDTSSAKSVASIKFLKTPTENYSVSYNWWTSNYDPSVKSWGPMKQDDFNSNGYLPDSLLGIPKGDKAKYRLMSNEEIDYNQNLTNLDHSSQGCLATPDSSLNFANGFDQMFLVSIGKWDLLPGDSLHIAFAIIMGDDFHGADSVPYPFDMNYPESAYFDNSNLLYNVDIAQQLYDTLISKITMVEEENLFLPVYFDLAQNYPNPFNISTSIPFSLKVHGSMFDNPVHTTLTIYNILGQTVRILVDDLKPIGSYHVTWDGKDDKGYEVSSGVYFYQLKVGDNKETKKMTFLK